MTGKRILNTAITLRFLMMYDDELEQRAHCYTAEFAWKHSMLRLEGKEASKNEIAKKTGGSDYKTISPGFQFIFIVFNRTPGCL